MKLACIFLALMLSFVSTSHWIWNQSRNLTGYDTFETVQDENDSKSGFLKSIRLDHHNLQGDRKKCYNTGFSESSNGAAPMFEATFYNYIEGELGKGSTFFPKSVMKYIHQQMNWMSKKIKEETENIQFKDGKYYQSAHDKVQPISTETEYWMAVDCVLLWVQGMWEGLEASGTNLTYDQFLALPYMADMEDILAAFGGDRFRNKQAQEAKAMVKEMGDCTIVMKDVEDDILVAHNTHNVYSIMLRLFKTTTIKWNQQDHQSANKTQTMRYSGRYGAIGSKDDFYVLSNGMIVMETSILIFNESLYDLLVPETVPYFVRVTVANWLSSDNLQWISNFSKFNSGTHVAQWILIDTKKPKYSENSINLLDIIMNDYESFDISHEFKRKGYWGAYNVPYSERIFKTCNYDPVEHSYTTEERAVIIRDKIGNVHNKEDVKHLIRFNGNTTNPCTSIAPRCDLASGKDSRPFGAIDGKYTQWSWVRNGILTYEAVVSPSFENDAFPPFAFGGNWESVPHRSTPTVYNFTWDYV